MAHVKVLNEVPTTKSEGWQLCFQECIYQNDENDENNGYRFIWRRPDGTLQAVRGQTRIGFANEMLKLMCLAQEAGWFNFNYKSCEFLIIAGTQNSGKTTTSWLVYQKLRAYSSETHLFIDGKEIENYGDIIFTDETEQYPIDFKAVLHISGYKIIILSAGDVADWLEDDIDSSLDEGADFIVLPLRSYDRSGSSRRMLNNTYPMYHKREFWIVKDNQYLSQSAILNYHRPTADKIANYLLLLINPKELL